jgi:hypothetical protein
VLLLALWTEPGASVQGAGARECSAANENEGRLLLFGKKVNVSEAQLLVADGRTREQLTLMAGALQSGSSTLRMSFADEKLDWANVRQQTRKFDGQ